MKTIILVREHHSGPCAYRLCDLEDAIEHVKQAILLASNVDIRYEQMSEEQYENLKEFEGVP